MPTLPGAVLTTSRVPLPDAPPGEIIRFAQTFDGYEVCGGAVELGRYVRELEQQPLDLLEIDDLRILLFARQRAHYFQGGSWGEADPLMDEMRAMTGLIREFVAARKQSLGVWRGDITTLDVDAIVNAADERMLGGGGVDGAIHRAAGPLLKEACRAVPEVRPGVRCPTGEARLTPGFDLPASHVIHTVGPVWVGGDHGESALLASAYRSSLTLGAQHRCESMAFPAISTGVFGFPSERAARVARDAIRSFHGETDRPSKVLLVAFDEASERALRAAVGGSEGR